MASKGLHDKYSNYHYCVVRECKNTSIKNPEKLWIKVPSEESILGRLVLSALTNPESMLIFNKFTLPLYGIIFELKVIFINGDMRQLAYCIEVAMADNATNSPSILEWLNKDCFQEVLSFLDTGDILRSADVSRRWREEVVEYLRGYRFCFEFYHDPRSRYIPRELGLLGPEDTRDRRVTPFNLCHGDPTQLGTKIEQLGPAIFSIALDRLDGQILKIISENCPNLKEFMLAGQQVPILAYYRPTYVDLWIKERSKEMAEIFAFAEDVVQSIHNMQLKRVSFLHSPIVPETAIAEFLKSDSLEEIIICRNRLVSGSCFSGLRATNLTSLRLNACDIDPAHLMSISDRLSSLTTLDLSNNPPEFLNKIPLLLQKAPKLVNVSLNTYMRIDIGTELPETLTSLAHLKHLSMCWNQNVSDEWLEIIGAGCKTLQTLDIETKEMGGLNTTRSIFGEGDCVVGPRGLCALGGTALQELGLAGRTAAPAALPACLALCPALQSVDVRGCTLTPALLAEMSYARRGLPGTITLRAARTAIARHDLLPEAIAINFMDVPSTFRMV